MSSIPRTHMMEEPIPTSCHLTSTQALWCMCAHMYTHNTDICPFRLWWDSSVWLCHNWLEKPLKPGRNHCLTNIRINMRSSNLGTSELSLTIVTKSRLQYRLLWERTHSTQALLPGSHLTEESNNNRHLKGQKVNFIDCWSYHETPIRNNYKIMQVF